MKYLKLQLFSLHSSLGQLYRNLPAIGHCISVLVASLQSWGSRDVQRASLTTLLALSGLAEEDIALFTGELYRLYTGAICTRSLSNR